MATILDLSPFIRVPFVTADRTLTPEASRALSIAQARLGGVMGLVGASTISYTPSGAMIALDVQTAVDELESRKATNTALATHLGDNTAHNNSAAGIRSKLGITTLSGSNTGDQATITGNAGTATALETARNINGVSFNGTASIVTPPAYLTGAGGAVVQLTSKATGVTLNKACGEITLNAAALAAGVSVSFTLINSTLGADDALICHRKSGGTAGAYDISVDSVAAGSCVIRVRNNTAGSLAETVLLTFAAIKAVAA